MQTMPILVTSVLIAAALSGCLGGDDATPADSSETTSADPGAGTGGPAGLENTPPVASFVVSFNGTQLVPEQGIFMVDAGVNLTFDATGSTDAEDAELSYAWDFSLLGNGSAAVEMFAFPSEGNYTVTVTVTDSQGAASTANASFAVAAAEPAAPNYLFFDDADTPTKWTFVRHIQVSALHSSSEPVIQQNHPNSAGWHVSSKHFRSGTKGWSMQDEAKGTYHVGEYTHMTSQKIDLTGASSATLSFYAKGWGEDNKYDGLYWLISTDGTAWTQLGTVTTELQDWTLFTVDLRKGGYVGKTIQLRFLFRSDSSCDGDTTQLPQDGNVCGKGKYIGYHLDDIMVAP